ncbi:MAG TPA: GtrA family protein [Dokdonella sp.]
MSLARQGSRFVLVGCAQCALDWSVMVGLSRAGAAVAAANIAGRAVGALLGFWLNGTITFASADARPGWRQFARYAVLWCANAALSTAAVSALDLAHGRRSAWIGKPLVDGAIALASFLVSRRWVYRYR